MHQLESAVVCTALTQSTLPTNDISSKLLACRVARRALDAPEPDVTGRGVDRLRMTSSRTIAPTVIRSAKMGSSLEDLARDADRRLPHVEASGLRPSSRVRRNAACLGNLIDVTRAVPIQGPLPDIADHVVDAVAIWRKCVHRGRSIESVGRQVTLGKSPCQVFAMWRPAGVNSLPHANSAPSRPPRAANSHSASVGKSRPRQAA